MPCDTRLRPGQTITERKNEVTKAVDDLSKLLAAGRVKVNIDKASGAINFGWTDRDGRNGVTDACAYRRVMATGSASAKMAIARAEQLAGRSVSKQAVAQGTHSHDGGKTWHSHKG